MATQITKWGNSLAVRIPKVVADNAGLQAGDPISIAVTKDGSVMIRAARPRYSLKKLVSGITDRNRHDATDWGGPFGKEAW
jgi:antitoxin MazE